MNHRLERVNLLGQVIVRSRKRRFSEPGGTQGSEPPGADDRG